VLLLLVHISINTINLHRQAGEDEQAKAFLNSRFAALTDWCRANIPVDEKIASLDYRELILRLDRPVMPLAYSSDTGMQIAQLERGDVKWLILCWHVFPLRGTYAKHIVEALGQKASLKYRNDSCEVYRIDVRQRIPAADELGARTRSPWPAHYGTVGSDARL